MTGIFALLASVAWLAVLLLPWQPWRSRPTLEDPPGAPPPSTPQKITAIIPARNEGALIGRCLAALAGQANALEVILVDDNSTDGTAQAARAAAAGLDLRIVSGQPLPPGWSGKLWALEQGVRQAHSPLLLLLDADIVLAPGTLAALAERLRGGCRMVSVMAALHMGTFWEKLLMPAFIFFFKLLYPFQLANSPDRRFSSAAGGCILLEASLLEEIGGFGSIRQAVIDDCALAARVKQHGAHTWIGQSQRVRSVRAYRGLAEIWDMVARSAYAQLHYSILWLALCCLTLITLFGTPLAALFSVFPLVRLAGCTAWLAMSAAYLPTLRYYRRSPAWVLLLPLTAGLYLAMTCSSALRFWRGERTRWKGRIYR